MLSENVYKKCWQKFGYFGYNPIKNFAAKQRTYGHSLHHIRMDIPFLLSPIMLSF
jgi:hypothetical protein